MDSSEVIHIPPSPSEQILFLFCAGTFGQHGFSSPIGIRAYAAAAAKSLQSCPTLCDPIDCSPAGSSLHGILQASVLEWVAISFSRGSSQPRDQTQVSRIAGRRFNL